MREGQSEETMVSNANDARKGRDVDVGVWVERDWKIVIGVLMAYFEDFDPGCSGAGPAAAAAYHANFQT